MCHTIIMYGGGAEYSHTFKAHSYTHKKFHTQSVCLSTHISSSTHWKDFCEILYLTLLWKSIKIILVWVKWDKSVLFFWWHKITVKPFWHWHVTKKNRNTLLCSHFNSDNIKRMQCCCRSCVTETLYSGSNTYAFAH